MRVVVAGGGVGGVCAALALARAGARAVVVERAAAFSEVGAGLQLSPNATRLLFRLGLEADLRRAAFAPRAAEVRDRADGRLLLSTPLGEAAERRWGAPYLQLHRADLLSLLLHAAAEAGVELRPGAPLQSFEASGTGVIVQAGDERITADVLVGADGVRSRVRSLLFGERPARFTGQIAWRGLVEASRLPDGLIAPAATVWTGPGAHFVHYYVRDGALVNFAGFTAGRHATGESWTEPAGSGEIAAAFQGWSEPVQALLAAQAAAGQGGWRAAVHDRPPDPRWCRGPVALLGDAAHPMPPYLAQGAGMSVEDAEALTRHLVAGGEPDQALVGYAAERFERTRRVQAWARRNGSVFHLPTLLRRSAFAVARQGGSEKRLDWLYGYCPAGAN
jgi:salicylate hydroxylase